MGLAEAGAELVVSIHAPREGCDFAVCFVCSASAFQFTHPGRGATSVGRIYRLTSERFQFTHPGRGATYVYNKVYSECAVSIHAPREGCDVAGNRE